MQIHTHTHTRNLFFFVSLTHMSTRDQKVTHKSATRRQPSCLEDALPWALPPSLIHRLPSGCALVFPRTRHTHTADEKKSRSRMILPFFCRTKNPRHTRKLSLTTNGPPPTNQKKKTMRSLDPKKKNPSGSSGPQLLPGCPSSHGAAPLHRRT